MPRKASLTKEQQTELLVYLYALRMVVNKQTGKPYTPKEISAIAGAAEGWFHNAMHRGGGVSEHFFNKVRKYVDKLAIPKDIMFEARKQVNARSTQDNARKPRRRLRPDVFELIDKPIEKRYDHLQDKHPALSADFIAGNIGTKVETKVETKLSIQEFADKHKDLDERLRSLYDEFHALSKNAPVGLRSLMRLKEEAFTEFVLTYATEE